MATYSPAPPTEIVVVSGTDRAYVMPLAVTIRSALDRLSPNSRIRLFLLDGGVPKEDKARLQASWRDQRLTVEWLTPNLELVRDLPVSDHISAAAYLRLLMPALIPAEVERVIYLDADMFVSRDLAQLWAEPQGEHAVLAVQDLAAPFFDSEAVAPSFDRCRRHLAASRPIANYQELGLPTDNKYFNSGLLVLDLAQWRREQIAEQVLDCLRVNRRHVLWWDQYALNVVLARKWRELDLRWNQGAHIYVYPGPQESWLDEDTFARLRNNPWIVHFCSPDKPWNYFCRHPFTRDWRAALRKTDWRDWQAEKPAQYLAKLWDFHYRPLRNEWKRQVRSFKQSIRGRAA